MPLYSADTIEIWRSLTGTAPDDFSLVAHFDDPGTGWTWTDRTVRPQQLYIYKSRRWQLSTETFSGYSPFLYGRGPWPQGVSMAGKVYTGIQTLLGGGRELVEGQPVEAQGLLRRESGGIELTRTDPDQQELQDSDVIDIDSVPGEAKVEGSYVGNLTPEGIGLLLNGKYGDPTTMDGGGTAPAAPALATATVGGTILANTSIDVRVAYVRPTDWEQTTASASTTHETGAGTDTNTLTVTSPAAQYGAPSYNVYARVGADGYTKQNALPIAIGTDFVLTAPLSTTGYPAPEAFYVHTWLGSTSHVPFTLLEKKGPAFIAYPGVVTDTMEVTVEKSLAKPVQATWGLKALNELIYAALTDLGLDAAGFDLNKAWAQVQAKVLIANTIAENAKKMSFKLDGKKQAASGLDGTMGGFTHYCEGNENTGSMDMYFQTLAESNVYFAQLDSVSKPYGAKADIRTVPLQLVIASNINPLGYRFKLIVTFPKVAYKKVGKPVQGAGAIMQAVTWKAFLDAVLGASVSIAVWNSQSHATVIAEGTPISAVPLNDVTAYSL